MAELVSIKRNVDVSPGQAAPAVFHCSQGDVGSKIILGLLNNGTAYAIPSGVTVTIEGSESNGSIFTPISATVSGSDITFYLTGEMTAVAGPAICQAVLKSGSNILGTANFTLEVESSPMGADAPPVFTDAGWTWMLNKLTTEFVPALGDNIIDAIDSKLDKNQGTANAGKYLKVGADGNVETADIDVTTDKTLSITDKAADAKAVRDELDGLKADLDSVHKNLPWFATFPHSIFSHGQVLYGTGAWSDTVTRWGTKDLQYTSKDLYLTINSYTPALVYQICFFDSNGTYKSWSGWQTAASAQYKINAGSYFKITIARKVDTSAVATQDYIDQILIDTKIASDITSLKENVVDIIPGMRINPQWVRGYRSSKGGRPSATTDSMNRFITTYEPIYLYKGSYFYCDTKRLYRYDLIKYADSQGNKVDAIVSDHIIPVEENKILINETGYYAINIQRYDNGRVEIDDFNGHVTMALYTNRENPIHTIFVGGGKGNFQAPGDSSLIIGATGKSIMIDCGLDDTQGQMLNCRASNGIESPDYIIISHMHDDHIGGLVKLLDNNIFTLDNKTIFLPNQNGIDYAIAQGFMGEKSTRLYNELMAYINNATNLTIIRPDTEFEEYYIDGMTFKFWNVDHQPYIDLQDTNYNDFSLCCNLEYGNQRLCYTGDLGPIGMELNAGKNYKSNVYKAQHHGWDNITEATDILNMKKWLSTVFPEIVISEDGIAHDTLLLNDNAPMPNWCENNGIPFYRTNQNGFIHVRVYRDSWEITTPVIRWTKSENPIT